MDNKIKIEGLLKDSPQGITIIELVNKSKLSWNTITKTLAMIEGEGNLKIRNIGNAKLNYWIFKKLHKNKRRYERGLLIEN